MECPICYDTNETYSLRGCSHSVCLSCADKMRKTCCIKSPFSNNITVLLHRPMTPLEMCTSSFDLHEWEKNNQTRRQYTSLVCPLCRTSEPIQYDMEVLRKQFPDEYAFWLSTELRWDGNYGFHHSVDSVCFGYGTKRHNRVYIRGFCKGDVVTKNNAWNYNRSLEYNVMDNKLLFKENLNEYKRAKYRFTAIRSKSAIKLGRFKSRSNNYG